jgi:anti-sigma factor (TIGR02949 family)
MDPQPQMPAPTTSSRLGHRTAQNTFPSDTPPLGASVPFGSAAPWWAAPNRQVPEPSDPFGEICADTDATCQAAIERLYFFLDGELTLDRRSSIQSHLAACPSCFGAFGFEAELRSVVQRGVHVQVPESLVDRIRQAIDSSKGDSSKSLPAPE